TAHKDEMALAIVQPVFQQFTEGYPAPSEEDQIISSDSGSDDDGVEGAAATMVTSKLTHTQQIQVAQTLGEILLRLKRPPEALPYFQTPRRLQTALANCRFLDRPFPTMHNVRSNEITHMQQTSIRVLARYAVSVCCGS